MITVKLFAGFKDKAGKAELTITAGPSTVSELLSQISKECPALLDALSAGALMVSINQEFVKKDALVSDGDEVALMPPFSGGGDELPKVRIQTGPFSIDRELDVLKKSSTSIGAVVSFLGTTRDVSRNKKVAKLEFDHYPGMAEKKLEQIRKHAIEEYGVIEVTIIHRVGVIPVGENIVLIAVAAAHRAAAFEACRYCIDELKRITPIWKKETTPEGEVWVEEHP